MSDEQREIRLPLDFLTDGNLPNENVGRLILNVSDDYEDELNSAEFDTEAILIQRLLTLARRDGVEISVIWQERIAQKVVQSASIYPLLSVLILLQNIKHSRACIDGGYEDIDWSTTRRKIFDYRFAKDLFSDSELVVCADSLGRGRPHDFYIEKTLRLRGREDFETLVADALEPHLGASARRDFYTNINALGVVLAELFENTDRHAKNNIDGSSIKFDCIRGVIFKRIRRSIPFYVPKIIEPQSKLVDCFEISVFDSGVGYYSSYMKEKISSEIDLEKEWKVVHNCLERHSYQDLPDVRSGHRAMGLYEVLRALQVLRGRIEIRTGRIYGYRTFIEGEMQSLMKPRGDGAHSSWPQPKLLDMKNKFSPKPSEQKIMVGSSVRVIVPLG